MPHRSHEWPGTLAQLRIAFADAEHFSVQDPIPPAFGDEGAANHMRLTSKHGEPGLELFVYGVTGGAFPARQHLQASKAIARLHGLDPERTLFVEQSEEALTNWPLRIAVKSLASANSGSPDSSWSKCRLRKSRSAMRSLPICSMHSS
jgi:succinylarginine dihydrolase